jgi:hypothetical protein
MAGCGGSPQDSSVKTPAQARRVIDERAGTYRGVGIGEGKNAIVAHLGAPTSVNRAGNYQPIGRTLYDNFHPGSGGCHVGPVVLRGRARFVRYPSSSFILEGGRICSVMVVEPGAATSRGVAIGDALGAARRAYPGIHCAHHRYVNDEGIAVVDFPYCTERSGRSRYVWFGGDPIDTIELAANPRY